MQIIRKGLLLALVFISSWMISLPGSAQTTNLTISTNQLPVGDDYAYSQRGYFWDFSDISHYAMEMTRDHLFGGGSISGGWLSGTVNSAISGPAIWLLTPSDLGSNVTQYEGAYKPIDPSHFRYLTMRICMEESNIYGAILWYPNRSEVGISSAFPLYSGCQVISIDLANSYDGIGIRWNSGRLIEGVAITFLKTNTVFSLDYVRLSATDPALNPSMDINWPPINGSYSLYFDSEIDNSKKTLIDSGLNGQSGTYSWNNMPDLAPNKYHFILELDNTVITSPSFVINSPPSTSIISPSFTSGPDYATVVIGNAWDMNDLNDISQTFNIENLRIVNGILHGISTGVNRDPILFLNGPQKIPINSNSYYYFTYRMRDLKMQDIAGGSVARVFWKHQQTDVISTTEDIIIFDNWKTVTIDLRKAILEPGSRIWSSAAVDLLRFDPNEFISPRNFEIDDIKLTGNSRVNSTFTVGYNASDLDGATPQMQFFYSGNPNGTNAIPFICTIVTTPPPTIGPHNIYLPLVLKDAVFGGNSSIGSPQSCTWNVSQVPAGTYYIVIEGSDGMDTVRRISDAPVEIFH